MAEVPASPIPPSDSRLCDEPRRPGPGSAAANGNQSVKALVYVAAFAPEKAVMLLRIGPRQVYLRGMVWLSVTALWHIGCMRSQVITIMAPEDEAAFLRFVFERPTVYLIPDERNSTPEIPHTRDVRGIRSMHCMLWDKAILPRPQVEHIPSRNDYHLRSAESLIQFLRSRLKEDSILAGRIALSTGRRGGPIRTRRPRVR